MRINISIEHCSNTISFRFRVFSTTLLIHIYYLLVLLHYFELVVMKLIVISGDVVMLFLFYIDVLLHHFIGKCCFHLRVEVKLLLLTKVHVLAVFTLGFVWNFLQSLINCMYAHVNVSVCVCVQTKCLQLEFYTLLLFIIVYS